MERKFSKDNLLKRTEEIRKMIESCFPEKQTVSAIDLDLVLEKLRNLYDQVLNLKSNGLDEKMTEVPVKKQVTEPVISSTAIEEEIYRSERDKTEIQSDEIISPKSETQKSEEPPKKHEQKPDLFSTISSDSNTIGDQLNDTQAKETIADQMQKKKIENLKVAIGINDKFYFVNELFGGNLNDYNKTIESLDSQTGKSEAMALFGNLEKELGWDPEAESTTQLKQFIERKYS